MKILKNKYVQATIRHGLTIAGVYVATTFAGNEIILGYAAAGFAYLSSLLDKAKNQ